MQEIVTFFFGMAIALILGGYGIAWMNGGSASANRLAQWILRHTQRGLRNTLIALGRTIGRFCQSHPFAAGIIILILLLILAFRA